MVHVVTLMVAPDEAVGQAIKIGYDRILGDLAEDVSTWTAEQGALNRIPLLSADESADAEVLDVRQASEFATGHLAGARHVDLGDLERGQ